MTLVETDFILALASRRDAHHDEAVRILEELGVELALSPYAILELELMASSGALKVASLEALHRALQDVLDYYGVRVLPPRPAHLAKAAELRARYAELSYFNSLHAGAAMVEGEELVSYDGVYASIEGLRYVHPSKAAERAKRRT